LLSYHNLAALAFLMADAREAIVEGRWAAFRDGVLGGVLAS
jgi:queuine/archaeosine tRNA-ribosyltransferase